MSVLNDYEYILKKKVDEIKKNIRTSEKDFADSWEKEMYIAEQRSEKQTYLKALEAVVTLQEIEDDLILDDLEG